jgi:thiamine biosynthesis protein ThiS
LVSCADVLVPAAVEVLLNGERKSLPAGVTIRDLLAELKLDARYLAVEVNRRVVPRGQHAATGLQSGDEIEIVTLVGGG